MLERYTWIMANGFTADPTLRITKKPLAATQKKVEILEGDINPDAEAVNAQQNVAEVTVPMSVFLSELQIPVFCF